MIDSKVLILDNGAGYIKCGTEKHNVPIAIPNCSARVNASMNVYIGEQTQNALDGSLLKFSRPFDCGYLTNWFCQIEIWRHIFASVHMNVSPNDFSLVLTEPMVNPESLQNDTNEVVFEEFGFKEYLRRPSCWFSAYEAAARGMTDGNNACTIVDSGFSFTHSVPFISGKCRTKFARRVNVGGKMLTNYLKEIVSYRQWNMMDEFTMMNCVKEELCYVSMDVISELRKAKLLGGRNAVDIFEQPLKRAYVLPDYKDVMKGHVKPVDEPLNQSEQLLMMETERFAVPELLFRPSDIGIDQAGVAEATAQSLHSLGEVELGLAAANIILTGGNVQFPQFQARYESELRPLIPDHFPVRFHLPDRPSEFAWQGAARFARNAANDSKILDKRGRKGLSKYMVTRTEYLEKGSQYCNFFFREFYE